MKPKQTMTPLTRPPIRLLAVWLVLAAAPLTAQEQPRLALVPLQAVGVSQAEAKTLTSLFETGLVKTGSFTVIEQNQIKQILDVQKYSLSDCTDESCAVEIGKLLAAEQVVLGDVSKIGNKYVMTAKIIDVAQGKNLRADTVETATIDAMTEAAHTLAFKLAGLTVVTGQQEQIATQFGEIFIATDPEGAEVWVNGMRKGTSPLVVNRVPVGTATVTAQKGDYFAQEQINVRAGRTEELALELEIKLGKLFIRSSEKDVTVSLDGKKLGPLESGFFRDLPVGEHMITLEGEGLFWQEQVRIKSDETTTVKAYPRKVGRMSITLPSGARGELTGAGGYIKALSGRVVLDHVPAGTYTLKAWGEMYKDYEARFTLSQGRNIEISPQIEYTEEHKRRQAAAAREKARQSLEERYQKLSSKSDMEADPGLLESIAVLQADIAAAPYDFEDLQGNAEQLYQKIEREVLLKDLLARQRELKAELETLQARYARSVERKKELKKSSWFFGIVGAAGFAGMGTGMYFGDQEYKRYLSASTTAEAKACREKLEKYRIINLTTATVGAVGSFLGFVLPETGDTPEKLAARVASTSRELAVLRTKIEELGGTQ